MSQPLPVGNFRFLSKEEIAHFDVMKIPTHCDTGYIVECDLKYPPELHDLYSATAWHRNISPSRQTWLAIFVGKLKPKIGNRCKNSFTTSSTKLTMFAIIETYNSISNMGAF